MTAAPLIEQTHDGSVWVCVDCGSTVTGPAAPPQCPKGCGLMNRVEEIARNNSEPTFSIETPPVVTLSPRTDEQGRELCSYPSCKSRLGLQNGVDGLPLCAWHDPGRKALRREAQKRNKVQPEKEKRVNLEDLPVQSIENIDDALELARWIPVAIATGKIGGREATALVNALKEYRMMVADATSIARLKALEEQMKLLKAESSKKQ